MTVTRHLVAAGYSPWVAEPALGLTAGYPWSAPYEELQLKAR